MQLIYEYNLIIRIITYYSSNNLSTHFNLSYDQIDNQLTIARGMLNHTFDLKSFGTSVRASEIKSSDLQIRSLDFIPLALTDVTKRL